MTYFLGKDVDLYITTESKYGALSGNTGTLTVGQMGGNITDTIIPGSNVGGDTTGAFVIPVRASGAIAKTVITDVTGIDFSPANMNEDLSFFGRNTNLSAEIKKEFVVTVTRKVTNSCFDQLYNSARDGVYNTGGPDASGGTWKIHDGLTTSDNQNFGYRLYLTFKDSTSGTIPTNEVMAICNACITSHTRTVSPDSAQEETIEFYSYVQPIMVSGAAETELVALTSGTAI